MSPSTYTSGYKSINALNLSLLLPMDSSVGILCQAKSFLHTPGTFPVYYPYIIIPASSFRPVVLNFPDSVTLPHNCSHYGNPNH